MKIIEGRVKIKETFFILSILQLLVAIPFDNTNLMPIFGLLSCTWAFLALILPPITP